MIRNCVRAPCNMTVFSDSTAALPVAAPRSLGPFGLVWPGGRGRPMNSLSRGRTLHLDWTQAAYHAVLFACGIAFGLLVGGYVGYMENATPHADDPACLARLAVSDVGWAATMRQQTAASSGHLLFAPENGGVVPAASRGVRAASGRTCGFRRVVSSTTCGASAGSEMGKVRWFKGASDDAR